MKNLEKIKQLAAIAEKEYIESTHYASRFSFKHNVPILFLERFSELLEESFVNPDKTVEVDVR
jgi:hypothetical protein